jgi:hypothetical protein
MYCYEQERCGECVVDTDANACDAIVMSMQIMVAMQDVDRGLPK